MSNIKLPELSLVVLIGPSGSGKSSFARTHFKPTEVLSSDFCRGLVADDENDQSATKEAFDVLHFILRKRLAAGRLTVIDATNVQPEARKPLVAIAREYHVLPVAIVLDLPEKLCFERNASRADRQFGPHVIRNQSTQLRRSIRGLAKEGFRHLFVLQSPEEVEAATISREPLYNNLKHVAGPFDFIGDVHGCFDELRLLLSNLGYEASGEPLQLAHPEGRKAVFVGDLVDRGPKTPDVLRLVMSMVRSGSALCVPGNHDVKLMRNLQGKQVKVTHGLAESLEQLEAETPEFRADVVKFLDALVSHYVLDSGRVVVAHAGMKEEMQGRGSGRVREFALYGETTGETDEYGLPVRYNWAADYRGRATVVYGHTPVVEPEWINRTICIDTGCVFGGKLTALRYPEKELVSVPAAKVYYESSRTLQATITEAHAHDSLSVQQQLDDVLDLDDVFGKRIVSTRLRPNITIREENATAALEVMSRFAANPKWLVYLPPTMSPSATSSRYGFLETPVEAFDYFRAEGVGSVVCEEKHMGSRAVVIVCRDEDVARKRFGVAGEGAGIVYTRTGRRFFNDDQRETALLDRLRSRLDVSGAWDEFATDWFVLDCELMPWSAKAFELLRDQYAAVGSAARGATRSVLAVLAAARARGVEMNGLEPEYRERADAVQSYVQAYRRYCWEVQSIDDLRLAPFHILATEGKVHVDKDHAWHMTTVARITGAKGPETQGGSIDPIFIATPFRVVELSDEQQVNDAIAWWTELTEAGGEGMVVKPLPFIATGKKGLIQPAVKCRGREYLRIIYGPEYTRPGNLARLRQRGLGSKRSLALREFALGVESLERFVAREPLRRVHECAFAVLALESEPVDPRL